MRMESLRSIDLKWLAILMMMIDHIAAVFFPLDSWVYLFARNLGRIAAPLFAFLLVAGFLVSRDTKQYQRRLLIYALLSQIPFTLMTLAAFPEGRDQFWTLMLLSWNVMVVLWASALALSLWEVVKSRDRSVKIYFFIMCYVGWGFLTIFADNGGLIPIWVLIFFAFRDRVHMCIVGYLGVLAIFLTCGIFMEGAIFPPNIQWWMLFGYGMVPVILYRFPAAAMLYRHSTRPPRWQRTFFYAWYPVHMLIISGVAYLLD